VASPDKKAFLLRLPPEVWSQIERLAASELRSVNGQIEYLLREALARRVGTGTAVAPDSDQSAVQARRGAPKAKR
jgi:hypothetical protein